MEIRIERRYFCDKYVIGSLFIGDTKFCDTLEPPTHGVSHPCIPIGEYLVNIVWSPKFKSYKPRLEDVPNRSGILIHSGNSVKDTLGCILVGDNTLKGGLMYSRATFNDLMEVILQNIQYGHQVKVHILNVKK